MTKHWFLPGKIYIYALFYSSLSSNHWACIVNLLGEKHSEVPEDGEIKVSSLFLWCSQTREGRDKQTGPLQGRKGKSHQCDSGVLRQGL